MVRQASQIAERKLSSTGKLLLKRNRGKGESGFFTDEFYQDNGCEVSSKCLECPLSQCKYDDAWAFDEMRRYVKDFFICDLMKTENLSVDETALKLGVTSRTIFRTMARIKKSKMNTNSPDIQILLDITRKEYGGV